MATNALYKIQQREKEADRGGHLAKRQKVGEGLEEEEEVEISREEQLFKKKIRILDSVN